MNRWRANQVSYFFLQWVVHLFQEVHTFYLIFGIYWHKAVHNIPYYPLNLCRTFITSPIYFLISIICILYSPLLSWWIWQRFINFDFFKEPTFHFIYLYYCFLFSVSLLFPLIVIISILLIIWRFICSFFLIFNVETEVINLRHFTFSKIGFSNVNLGASTKSGITSLHIRHKNLSTTHFSFLPS